MHFIKHRTLVIIVIIIIIMNNNSNNNNELTREVIGLDSVEFNVPPDTV